MSETASPVASCVSVNRAANGWDGIGTGLRRSKKTILPSNFPRYFAKSASWLISTRTTCPVTAPWHETDQGAAWATKTMPSGGRQSHPGVCLAPRQSVLADIFQVDVASAEAAQRGLRPSIGFSHVGRPHQTRADPVGKIAFEGHDVVMPKSLRPNGGVGAKIDRFNRVCGDLGQDLKR